MESFIRRIEEKLTLAGYTTHGVIGITTPNLCMKQYYLHNHTGAMKHNCAIIVIYESDSEGIQSVEVYGYDGFATSKLL